VDQATADNISEIIGKAAPFVAPLNPLIPIGLSIVAKLIESEPKLEAALRALFTKPKLTAEDFEAAIAHIEEATYEQLCPHSALRSTGIGQSQP
jgi:hypothetical protein